MTQLEMWELLGFKKLSEYGYGISYKCNGTLDGISFKGIYPISYRCVSHSTQNLTYKVIVKFTWDLYKLERPFRALDSVPFNPENEVNAIMFSDQALDIRNHIDIFFNEG